ncbi:DUF349 domain-containing protein [Catenovulum sp. SM1970]|uniref:DUF349 domain-containing protein n=1 Tax=Marinifaba aquimaris TaxID=2741323 RepID=UPI0015738E75|nr:DUF349 domain-containing protein [Marinifaba aquimaris]NTS78543.1 DUF349 domain-containing protein [Marinifaba aquimaris]
MKIFKQLFQAKWKHQDAVIRLKALDELNLETESHIIKTLAFDDSDTRVRKRALERLNDLELFWQAHLKDKEETIKKQSLVKVSQLLLDQGTSQITEDEKKAFILNCNDKSLLETLVRDESNALSVQLKCDLLNKIDKATLDNEMAIKSNEVIALAAYDRVSHDIKTLEKLTQKAKAPLVVEKAQNALSALIEAQQKPIDLRKQASLVLSRLLALKDKTDYELIKHQGELLVAEWQSIVPEFSCFEDLEQQELNDKYVTICQKLDVATQSLKDAWFQEKQEREQAEQRASCLQKASVVIEEQSEVLSGLIEAENENAVASVLANLANAKTTLIESHYQGSDVEELLNKINQLESNAKKLPEFFEKISLLTRELTLLAQQNPPNQIEELDEKQQIFSTWLKNWRQLVKPLTLPLPVSINETSIALITQWQTAIAEYQAGQDKKIQLIRSKLKELKRLIFSGKYNAALGLFRKMSEWHGELTPANQGKIEKEYQVIHEKIDELADWKEYIAIPRKKELLEEVQALSQLENPDPTQQAKEVKALRQVWLLLGNVPTDENESLNQAFNEASELAFAPCRQYYQAQDEVRAQNLTHKQALIDELLSLEQTQSSEDFDISLLGRKLNDLMVRWNKIGFVDKSLHKSINDQFYSVFKPLKERSKKWNQDNLAAKQKLIQQAEEAQQLDDIQQAIDALKQLQNQWKDIGFAGPGKDKALWQAFRKINDNVFAKRDDLKRQEQSKQKSLSSNIDKQLLALSEDLKRVNSLKELEPIESSVRHLINDELKQELAEHQFKKLTASKNNLLDKLKAKRNELKNDKQLQKLTSFKQALIEWFESSNKLTEEEVAELGKPYAVFIKAAYQQATIPSDEALLAQSYEIRLKIEIAAEIAPLPEDNQKRMEIQVNLLADKHNQGQTLDTNQLILDWLGLGMIKEGDSLAKSVRTDLERVLLAL